MPETHRPTRGQDAADRHPPEPTVRRVTTADGAELALTRLAGAGRRGDGGERAPVVLVHGSYTHRGFWMRDDGVGLAVYLARHGYDVWVPELRGHGLSPKPEAFEQVTAEDHIRRDLPRVHDAVLDATDRRPVYVGHSSGGLYLLGALSRGWIEPDDVQALAVFGTQIRDGEAYLRLPGVAAALKALLGAIGYLPAPRLGMGPEIEPAGEMAEVIDWKAKQRWTDREGVPYREGLADLRMPVRAYAGADDTMDPPAGCKDLHDAIGSDEKSFQLLGREAGFSRDYGHAEMIASSAAADEVWPDLFAWLDQQA